MEAGRPLSEQRELAQGTESLRADDTVGAAERAQIEASVMSLLAGNLSPGLLNKPDYPQLSYDEVLGDVA